VSSARIGFAEFQKATTEGIISIHLLNKTTLPISINFLVNLKLKDISILTDSYFLG
jgi:hypothetical protein